MHYTGVKADGQIELVEGFVLFGCLRIREECLTNGRSDMVLY